MKFGARLDTESVPEWCLHNVDYNSLKRLIKSHTRRDQATAIVIPGHHDNALFKFEEELYQELYTQHDRVALFVSSKRDELARRLHHYSEVSERLIQRTTRSPRLLSTKKSHGKLARYNREVQRCHDELHNLDRFIGAQRVAFRKILKKYRKWTSSSTLDARFKENVLSNPKSFTRFDLQVLHSQCDELLSKLRSIKAAIGEATNNDISRPSTPCADSDRASNGPETPYIRSEPPNLAYWNEYENGDEADDARFYIYLPREDDDDDDSNATNLKTLLEYFTMPYARAKNLFSRKQFGLDQTHLLSTSGSTLEDGGSLEAGQSRGYGTVRESYFSQPPGAGAGAGAGAGVTPSTDDDDDDDDNNNTDDEMSVSDAEAFPRGYALSYAALPSIDEQKMVRYRESTLSHTTLGCYIASFLILGLATVSITTGRHKLRIEVDTAVGFGVVSSLAFAGAALVCTTMRNDRLSAWHRAAVYLAFIAACLLNGVLLVLVMGNLEL